MARMRGVGRRGGCVSEFKAEFPPATESAVAIIWVLLYATVARFEFRAVASRLPPALAALPIFPESRILHLLVQSRFVEHLLQFRPRLSRADSPGIVGQRKRRNRGDRYVAFQFRDVHFVKRVRRGVKIQHIVRRILIGYQR